MKTIHFCAQVSVKLQQNGEGALEPSQVSQESKSQGESWHLALALSLRK